MGSSTSSNEMDSRTQLYLSLCLADLELPQEEYCWIEAKPFREWPRELQDKLRPYGAESITEPGKPFPLSSPKQPTLDLPGLD